MISLGLSAREQRSFEAALAGPRVIDIKIKVTDLDHIYVSDISDRLLDGQVNIDSTAEITRSCTLSILDPDFVVGFDSEDPTDTQAYSNRMIRAEYGVYVPDLDRWVYVPVFHGPIISVTRTEGVVDIEAQGKEYLAKRAVWKTLSYPRGIRRHNAIIKLMRDLTGERRFDFPSGAWSARLGKTLTPGYASDMWRWCSSLAEGIPAQLFYDGRGYLRLRRNPVRPSYTFKDGPGGTILTQPSMSFGTDGDVVNTVLVKGGTPKGAKRRVEHYAYLPASHPRSPETLARGGVKGYRLEVIEDDTLTSRAQVEQAAKRRIKELMVDDVEVEFDTLPIPHIEPGDVVRVDAGGITTQFRMSKFTIPLSHGGVSTVGYLRRVTTKGRIRANRHRR